MKSTAKSSKSPRASADSAQAQPTHKPWCNILSQTLIFTALVAIPTIVILAHCHLDNDVWYLLSEGRYLTTHGFYYTDPLSMHLGLDVTVQNWLSATLFWLIYSFFGPIGLFVTAIIANFIICILFYQICMTVSQNNRKLSLIIMLIADLFLTSAFIVTRPQLFSFINILALILCLERYVHTGRAKHLIALPIISLLEVNLHASYWLMLFLFIAPYLIDSFKNKKLHLQGYRQAPLFTATIIALLVGFVNPYGLKAMTFIFTSFTDSHMHDIIAELHPTQFLDSTSFNSILNSLAVIGPIVCYFCFGRGKLRTRYILLLVGTIALSLISTKGFSHYLLVAFFPLADIFQNHLRTPLKIQRPAWLVSLLTQLRQPKNARLFRGACLIACGELIIVVTIMFMNVTPVLDNPHPAAAALDKADEIIASMEFGAASDYASAAPSSTSTPSIDTTSSTPSADTATSTPSATSSEPDPDASATVAASSSTPATRHPNFYVSFNDGGYVEFRGYYPYITPQAELFIEKNNHKEDIFAEYHALRKGDLNPTDLLEKYQFDFVLLGPSDGMFEGFDFPAHGYTLVYDDPTDQSYYLYQRN